MKILLVHNRYQQPGGEDEVFSREAALLRSKGNEVVEYVRDNDEIRRYTIQKKMSLAPRTIWAWDTVRALQSLLSREQPQVVHFHNTFPLVSPAAYYACNEAGVPVVQTLHNPRLLCPAATFFRDGHVCEECVGKTMPFPAMLHACYRDSRFQTAALASMLAIHRVLGTWRDQVSAFICSTQFYRNKFAESGLPSRKLFYKPHFLSADPGSRQGCGTYALFIGRLAAEKGVETLLNAWQNLPGLQIKIRGEGPLLPEAQRLQRGAPDCVELVSRCGQADLFQLIKGARFLVWPSLGYYETFGLVAIEAMACGVPVLGSRIGAMQEMVRDGVTGLHFTPGDPEDLAAKVAWAWNHPIEMQVMGRNARAEYESKYTSERNYEALVKIYSEAIGEREVHPFRGVAGLSAAVHKHS